MQLRIGDLAQRLNVSTDTLRRLEQQGKLSPQRDWAGHRRYTEDDVRCAQALLFSQLPERNAKADG